jgi:DNA-binding MarR family transcriptional regulator
MNGNNIMEKMTDPEIKSLLGIVLSDLMPSVLRLQEQRVSKFAAGNLSRTELHALEIIQDKPGAPLKQIAEIIGITTATVCISVQRLVEKGLIVKDFIEYDLRRNIYKLTQTGEEIYKKHKLFHEMLVQAVLQDFHASEYPKVLQSMQAFASFLGSLNF